jgi:glycine/D-amino acid oxidase-like deaminating enzyme
MAEPNGPGHPDSYYVATAIGMEDRPVLDSELTADVCVIGGGFTGLSAALNLAEQGMDVVLLEAERIGFGASGRANARMYWKPKSNSESNAQKSYGILRNAPRTRFEVASRNTRSTVICRRDRFSGFTRRVTLAMCGSWRMC